jgi:hypothetical protein
MIQVEALTLDRRRSDTEPVHHALASAGNSRLRSVPALGDLDREPQPRSSYRAPMNRRRRPSLPNRKQEYRRTGPSGRVLPLYPQRAYCVTRADTCLVPRARRAQRQNRLNRQSDGRTPPPPRERDLQCPLIRASTGRKTNGTSSEEIHNL